MLLSEVSKTIDIKKILHQKSNKHFNKINSSSKEVDKKTIFIIDSKKKIKKEYIDEAIKHKIPAIITNKIYHQLPLFQIVVKDIEKETQKLLTSLKPFKPINTIAITGTNGKTSVAWYISEICRLSNIKIKMQGTLGYYVNGKKTKNGSLTTPTYETLHQNGFSKFKNKYNFVFEASSHALHQNRIKKYPINIAAITNITHDHLDYHKSLLNYKNSKFKLFTRYLDKNGVAIINSRMKYFKTLVKILKKRKIKIIMYSIKDIYIKFSNKKFFLNIYNKKFKLNKLQLSYFHKQNLECAIACCLQLNVSPKLIVKSLKKIKSPPGRSETINLKKISSKVIIDYAHTPDALQNILKAHTFRNKKPSLVFGCGGNRDKGKRKVMGKIAFELAEKVIVTDDNPRNEKPQIIRSEILKYCSKAIEIPNRKVAIAEAVKNLEKNSILVIAGKGHEKIQILKHKTIPFDDVKIVKQILLQY